VINEPTYTLVFKDRVYLHYTNDTLPGCVKLKLSEISSYVHTYPHLYTPIQFRVDPISGESLFSYILACSPLYTNKEYPKDMVREVGWKVSTGLYMLAFSKSEEKEIHDDTRSKSEKESAENFG